METERDVRPYSKYTKNDEEHDLKEMPISVIRDLKQYQFSCPERIHSLIDSRISLYSLRQHYHTPTVSLSLRVHKESFSTWSWY
jgi:hypothetical protein